MIGAQEPYSAVRNQLWGRRIRRGV